MIKLFLSHASEDKDDFVRALAEALEKNGFEVWYDEYSLSLGDKLLGKISEGLKACDYGIVVLSKHFFNKKWPTEELEGLFALEVEDRKVILPIWKDVNQKDVANFSPILAARVATHSSLGIPAIVNQIMVATATGERKVSLSKRQSLLNKFKSFDAAITSEIASQQKLSRSESIEEIRQAGFLLLEEFQGGITDLNQESQTVKLLAESKSDRQVEDRELRRVVFVQCPYHIRARFEYDESVVLATERTRMRFQVWKSIPRELWEPPVGPKEPKNTILYEEEFSPQFDNRLELCWHGKTSDIRSEEIVDYLLGKLFEYIEKK